MNLRLTRNILFRIWLLNIALVIICWLFVITDLMQYFMWALPGFTLESANLYVMWLIGFVDVAAAMLFLMPAIAINWVMPEKKPASKVVTIAVPAKRKAKPAKKKK